MLLEEVKCVVREIVYKLVREDYEGLVAQASKSRLSSDDLSIVIHQYGRKLVSPPNDAYESIDAVQVMGITTPTWSVRVPLWTEEEGQSDLTLELTITLGAGIPSVEIDDIHVL